MTNEELKNMLFIIDTLLDDAITDSTRQKVKDSLTEVCQLAMKALEQQPTHGSTYGGVSWGGTYKEEAQPNSNEFFNFDAPMVKNSEVVSRGAVDKLSRDLVHVTRDKADFLCNFWEGLNALPSVYPERPKGKWIEIEIDAGEFIYKCTKCGMRVINPYKYCPNCGAEMGGEEDGKDSACG